MKKSRERTIRRLLPESPVLWLLSLVISVALWAAVHLEQNTAITIDVPLALSLPQDKVLVTDLPDKIKVTVTGPWTQLKNLESKNLTHEVDLTGFDLGTSMYYLDPNDFNLPPRTRAVRVSPSQLRISFARKISKVIPVTPNIVGQPAVGYEVRGFTCQPAEIAIEGAESEVSLLEEAVTEEVDISDRKSGLTDEVGLFLLSRNVWPKSKTKFRVTVDIEPIQSSRDFRNIRVRLAAPAKLGKLVAVPPAVMVTLVAPTKVLSSVDPEKLYASVDLSGVSTVTASGLAKELEVEGVPKGATVKNVVPGTVKIMPVTRQAVQKNKKVSPMEDSLKQDRKEKKMKQRDNKGEIKNLKKEK
ncbi:MAG: hypothetical protein GXP49_17000 [Deltaproteobacteria bacterium]|nr:hypothetical protein [Deltaproteobacteria bacterium]